MGSVLSPVISDIFIDYFVTTALNNAQLVSKLLLIYKNDIAIIWVHGPQEPTENSKTQSTKNRETPRET